MHSYSKVGTRKVTEMSLVATQVLVAIGIFLVIIGVIALIGWILSSDWGDVVPFILAALMFLVCIGFIAWKVALSIVGKG